MLTLGEIIHRFRPMRSFAEKIHKYHAIELQADPGPGNGPPNLLIYNSRCPDALTAGALDMAHQEGANALIDVWVMSFFFMSSPKVFRPTLEQCLALEQIEMRMELKDYAQPYPTMAVEFPEAYRRLRRVEGHNNQGGMTMVSPAVTVIHHDSDRQFCVYNLILDPDDDYPQSIGGAMMQGYRADMESCISKGTDTSLPTRLQLTPGETLMSIGCFRVVLNSMLMLMQLGCRRGDYDNPSHAARLARRLAKANREEKASLRQELDQLPVEYGFEQNVTLYHTEQQESAGVGEGHHPGGWTMPTGWRRGHWRMQAHGPHNSLRKRILIKPVLVNAHLAMGAPVSVNYTAHERTS